MGTLGYINDMGLIIIGLLYKYSENCYRIVTRYTTS